MTINVDSKLAQLIGEQGIPEPRIILKYSQTSVCWILT
ncbi:hypothetical protein Syn7502_01154 [Synechococcus sp. PCC 7502]|nr:hypothetical protein Syn7502_01154 [Synechococcus sp. PCC 7502]